MGGIINHQNMGGLNLDCLETINKQHMVSAIVSAISARRLKFASYFVIVFVVVLLSFWRPVQVAIFSLLWPCTSTSACYRFLSRSCIGSAKEQAKVQGPGQLVIHQPAPEVPAGASGIGIQQVVAQGSRDGRVKLQRAPGGVADRGSAPVFTNMLT